ncbi:nuclear transport factor 2 family protein, partial [Pseudoalteromonas sp. Isolate6]|uniref:nuclear transport factor 2 family protein n=1 Tax=Pseudoalteromonas sp. Isolate6 TaxID=2908527 RepID=UPI001EFC5F46
ANDNFTSEQLIEKAKVFVAAKNARQQPNTTIKEIENYISLLSDDFIDEHVKFRFTYTDKSKLREDMINKLKDKVIHSSIEINEIMVGANVVFVKMTESGKVKPVHLDKTIEYSKTNIVSLEFNQAGLVTHIRRHHG